MTPNKRRRIVPSYVFVILTYQLWNHVGLAKLMLWPEHDEEEYYLSRHIHEEKKQKQSKKRTHRQRIPSPIRDRLRLFHHEDDSGYTMTESKYSYTLSPAKYLSLMLRYLQNQLSDLSTYLYSTNGEATTTSFSAYTLFRHTQYQNMVAEPKDAWEGLLSALSTLRTGYVSGMQSFVDGVYELGCGSISACVALFPSQNGSSGAEYRPLYSFLTELSIGLSRSAAHMKDGMLLFAAGAVVGTRNLMVGIARTPESVKSSRLGMLYYPMGKEKVDNRDTTTHRKVAVWDYYSLDYEDKEIQMEELRLKVDTPDSSKVDKKPDALRKRRQHVSVKDRKFYDILGVSTNANSQEIRSAYRREALRRHPDKQTATDESILQSTSIQGFIDLTEAYRILSNDASREAYDVHGLCYNQHPGDAFQAEATQDLISELFGADAVKNYIGNVEIASIVNEVFGFSLEDYEAAASTEIRSLRQRRRIVDIAKYLRSRVDAYVRGEITEKQFTVSCRKEVDEILKEGDKDFVAVIGRTLVQEADQRLGLVMPFVKGIGSGFARAVSSKVASARVYGPIYFRIALEGMVSNSYYDKNDTGDGDCSGKNRSGRHPVDQEAVLKLLWQYVVNDTVVALQEACNKVFADQGVRDGNLAFVKTQSLLKYQRAEAIRILGREFLAASSAACESK